MNNIVPIVRDSLDGVRYTDLFSNLLSSRIIMLHGEIDTNMAHMIVAKLLYLDAEAKKPIHIYINSPGGSVIAALAIYDAMQHIGSEVITVCIGEACSAASLLFVAGDRRLLCTHARILVHQPMGSTKGQASDLKLYVNEMKIIENQVLELYRKHTGLPLKMLIKIMDRDTVIRNEDAIRLKFADSMVEPSKHKKAKIIHTTKNKKSSDISLDLEESVI